MPKVIYQRRSPWNRDRQLTLIFNERAWQRLVEQFGVEKGLKLKIRRWWQSEYIFRYLIVTKIFQFFRIPKRFYFVLGRYYSRPHRVHLYVDYLLIAYRQRNDFCYRLAWTLAHEFGHALDRKEFLKADMRWIFMSEEARRGHCQRLETRANEFAEKNFGFFVNVLTVAEIKN